MGGSQIALIVVAEHLLSYPANRLSFYLARSGRFNAVYGLRLFGTFLRHGFAWIALLLTGSIEMAISAIVLRGLVFGALSLFWLYRDFSRTESKGKRLPWTAFTTFAAFTSTAFALLAIQEIPSIFIARTFSREVLGSYRYLYDLTAAIWFVATIYPTVLFSYLLPKYGISDPSATRHRIAPLSDALLVFHLTYYLAVSTLLSAMTRFELDLFSTQMPFAFGLTAAVSLLGYSRFQIEAVQALGKGRAALICVTVSAALVAAFFWLVPGMPDKQVIGIGWLLGQLVLAVLLRLVLSMSTGDIPAAIRDIAVMGVGFSSMSIAGNILTADALVWLGILLALASALTGIILFVRLFKLIREGDPARQPS
ncbi:hypothetical protein [Devosia sp.]|uniref:hypothetical protein n=1 Tax=Devosia sp. TaxID=1871048 RepID=UPI0025DBE4B0|nr:hypothetical protein [Devosia sp.]MCR6636420.1 hypothetical protein [Devosia sp.]